MVSIYLYVEGGGDRTSQHVECRKGFRKLLERAGLAGRMPRIFASGGRQSAFEDFCTAQAQAGANDYPMLLVDAEAPLSDVDRPWEHLSVRDGWVRPRGAEDDQCHLMVQVMESWFLADRRTLAGYFGDGFHEAALPGNPNVEGIPKADVLDGLQRATRGARKGSYDKGKHSFAILAAIDPGKAKSAAPAAARLFRTLGERAR